MTLSSLLSDALEIAVAAGQEILAVYNDESRPKVSLKADNSPLTDADRRAHVLIVERLRQLTADWPILSEESEAVKAQERLSWRTFWLVDPLDGTREFIKRNGEFTVNIAVIDQGLPVLGVVHVPVSGVSYIGARGEGAWKIPGAGGRQAIHCSKLALNRQLRVVASRSHRDDSVNSMLDSLESKFTDLEVLSMGSSLKICLLAEGAADFYPRLAPTSEWDTAAAHAVLLAAGGDIVDTTFTPLRYNQRDSILNPHFLALADPEFPWSEVLAPREKGVGGI